MNPLQPTIVRPFLVGATPLCAWVAYNILSDLYAPPIEPSSDDTPYDLRVKALHRYSAVHILVWVVVFGVVNILLFYANRWVMNF